MPLRKVRYGESWLYTRGVYALWRYFAILGCLIGFSIHWRPNTRFFRVDFDHDGYLWPVEGKPTRTVPRYTLRIQTRLLSRRKSDSLLEAEARNRDKWYREFNGQ